MPVPRPASPADVRPLPDGPVHFVGIGGAGQSAIAYVLASRGRVVRGSDPSISAASRARLESVGCEIFAAHNPNNLAPDTAALIATDAVNEHNPEVAEALQRGLPVFRRPEALANLVNSAKVAICVAGTHGKTTTTGMITSILLAAGLNPTVLIGGELPQIGGNARSGDPDLVVAEACEAYGGLDCLSPTIAVITNCEPDHLDYHGTEENFYNAFERFVQASQKLVACGEDEVAREMAWRTQDRHGDDFTKVRLYGFDEQVNRDTATPLTGEEGSERGIPGGANAFWLDIGDEDDPDSGRSFGIVQLSTPGNHNVLNATGAASVGAMLGLLADPILAGLESFTGTGRRFERLGEVNGIMIVDDYAHHPTEIRATLQAARQAFPERRLIAVYQPHLPSRTRDFLDGFAQALSQADVLYLTDIYLAREPEQPGLIEALVGLIGKPSPASPSPASYPSAPSSPDRSQAHWEEGLSRNSQSRLVPLPNEERVRGEEGRRLSSGEMAEGGGEMAEGGGEMAEGGGEMARRDGGEMVYLVKDRHELPAHLLPELKPGDVVLFMGAGNIREQAEELLRGL